MRVCFLTLLLLGVSVDGLNHFNHVKRNTESSLSDNSTAEDVVFAHDQQLNELVVEDDQPVLDEIKLQRLLGEISESDEYGVADIAKKAIQTKKVEGCYSSQTSTFMWKGTGKRFDLGAHNSNDKCQAKCRAAGKILAATRATWCFCGNIFPKGRKVENRLCNKRCVSYTECDGPQECCGGLGGWYYSLSVVGDIDVAKEVLERLRSKWKNVKDYRDDMMGKMGNVGFPSATKTANWWDSFGNIGWSMCEKNGHDNYLYMHGLWRSAGGGLNHLESADCREDALASTATQDCYDASWHKSFDHKGWSTCKKDYFLTGLYRNAGGNQLSHLKEAKCCRPPAAKWEGCMTQNVWEAFDNKGWTKCPSGYYMTGLWRNDCEDLHCIENFRCCKMATEAEFSIVVKDMKKGYTKKCTMKESGSHSCERVNETPGLSLETVRFDVEDKSPLNVAKPEVIPGFKPKICSASNTEYTCAMSRSVATTRGSSFSIGTGFSMGYSSTIGASVGFEGFGASATASFETTLSATASFNADVGRSESKEITDTIEVEVDVPERTQVTIDVKRVKQDLVYFWKGHFELIGTYTVQYGGNTVTEDVTRILSGNDRKFYSFGKWEYPGTDFHKVIITDKYGGKTSTTEKDCDQLKDEDNSCKV